MGLYSTVILIFSFILLVWGFEFFGKFDRILQMKKLENCKTRKNWPMSLGNFTVNYNKETKEHTMNVNVVVKEEVSPNFSMTFSFLKCDTSGNPDSCEFLFKDRKIENICKYVIMKDQSWSDFIGCFDREVKCPLKPNTYHGINLPLNSKSLNKLPVKDGVWKLNIGGYDKGKKIACADVEIKILTVRAEKA